MNIVLHIDVAKVTGCYSNVLTAKDALSADGVENPEVPIRVEEVEYGTYPKIKVDYIPIYEQGIENVFGSDWKQLDHIVNSCPAGSVTCGDLDDPEIGGILNTNHGWEGNEHRYELMQRVKLWRFVSGQPDYDLGERFLRRIEYNPQLAAV